jgi:hypothetical protein
MPDQARPPKRNNGPPAPPSRARGSRKEDPVEHRPPARGRLKLKPPADSDEPAEPARRKGSAKQEGTEPQPRTTSRKKLKPTAGETPSASRRSGSRRRQDDLDDQVARRGGRGGGSSEKSRGYVRFRVHVEYGQISIVDSHFVDSDLAMPPTIHGEYAYEVSLGDQLLHADTIPDLGVVRGFGDPHGTLEQRRHHTYRETSYDFDVRVPAAELAPPALPKIEIALYRTKDRAPTQRLTESAPLSVQFERELREMARLSGIPRNVLPSSLRR